VSRWFRMHDCILDDPQVQRLPENVFKIWVNSLALCSRNGGKLPSLKDCAFAFRETEASVSSAFHALTEADLFVTVDETFQPKNWKKRQYKSDTSTDRVREFRKRSRNGGETSPDTEAETDTEKEEKIMPATAGEYAFFGRVIKLTPRHFAEWKRLFKSIPDLEAELSTLDDWWQAQPEEKRSNWFLATKGMLNKRHQANLRERDDGYDPNVITV